MQAKGLQCSSSAWWHPIALPNDSSLPPHNPAIPPPARRYHEVYRRHNYTTPKSYLELISLYK